MAKKEKTELLRALEFVANAQRDAGAPYQTHTRLKNGWAIAFDGVLAAGHAIKEEIDACPHTFTLLAALRRLDGTLAVTQLDETRLNLRSGRFRANVACVPAANIPFIAPDPAVGSVDNRLRKGLATLAPFIAENSPRVVMASALLRANSMVATNGHLLLEYWHGIDLPPNIVLPKTFINALLKIDKTLVQFGYTDTSFTVYFDDGSWLRTQLYREKWPDTDSIMSKPHSVTPLPVGFFSALENIKDFIEDNRVRIRETAVCSHKDEGKGAMFEVSGIAAPCVLNAKELGLLDGLITSIDFAGVDNISYFYGENLRGAISQLKD